MKERKFLEISELTNAPFPLKSELYMNDADINKYTQAHIIEGVKFEEN